MLGGHAGRVELGLEVLPPLGRHRQGQVLQPAEHLGVGPEVEAGEVEERQRVAVADVEEEVGGAPVVTVLEHVGEGELEQVLVEAHGLLHVGAQQGHVVHAPRRRRRPVGVQVLGADAGAGGCDGVVVGRGFGHGRIVRPAWLGGPCG